MDLAKHLLTTLHKRLPNAKTLLIAVSGGSDSVALLRLFYPDSHPPQAQHLKHLAQTLGLQSKLEHLAVAHLDHALRESSAQDAVFVVNLCATLGLPCYTERLEVGRIAKEKKWNLEDAARRLRYAFLTKMAKQIKADAILTAHTLDDQAETVLMQLLRGTAFVTGIREKQHQILRPLLKVSRKELQDYLGHLGQDFCSDESNFDTQKTRAWLRHKILPELEQRYPHVKHTLARLATIQQSQKAHFDQLGQSFTKTGTVPGKIDIKHLLKQDRALQRHIVAQLAKGLEFEHIENILEKLSSQKSLHLALPHQKLARIAYGKFWVLNPDTQQKTSFLKPTPYQDLTLDWQAQIHEHVDTTKLASFTNLLLRHRQPGDSIQLSGGRKKVSDLLIDLKIPQEERDSLPLLASNQEVVWIKDLATDIRVTKGQSNPDVTYMKRALNLAQQGMRQGDLPVGCVIVKNGRIIAEACNQTESNNNPFAHAEVLAMQQAAKHLGDWRLEGCTLYVTLEPCPMCFGALLQAHVAKVVYGARNFRDGACGSVITMQEATWKRKVQVSGGVLEKACSDILSHFFDQRRKQTC